MDALFRLNREREHGGNSDAFPSPSHTDFTPTNEKKQNKANIQFNPNDGCALSSAS